MQDHSVTPTLVGALGLDEALTLAGVEELVEFRATYWFDTAEGGR